METELAHRSACVVLAGVLLAALAVAGCVAPTTRPTSGSATAITAEDELQKRIGLARQLEYQARLDRVSYPILKAGVPLCPDLVKPRFGINFGSRVQFASGLQGAAGELLGADDRVRVFTLNGGSPAERAGLQPRDVIAALNGAPVAGSKQGLKDFQALLDTAASSGTVAVFRIERDGQVLDVPIAPEPICYAMVKLLDQDELNAYSDGKGIYLTKGIVRFSENDSELAIVIAHELAHNAMGHIKATKTNAWWGILLDVAAAAYGVDTGGMFTRVAASTYSREFEAEADYVGLYFLALAGDPIDEVANFWRRMSAEHPPKGKADYFSTHPTNAERYVAIDAAVREIHAKQQSGAPLRPELKQPATK